MFSTTESSLNPRSVEAFRVVALFTLATEISFMHIVAAVTVNAAPVVRNVALFGFQVTTVAMRFSMRVPQFEAGFIVVEAPDQPGVGIVAIGAILAENALMSIIITMAINALLTRIAKHRREVAGFAAHHSVLTD
jgi:hypothetical protein